LHVPLSSIMIFMNWNTDHITIMILFIIVNSHCLTIMIVLFSPSLRLIIRILIYVSGCKTLSLETYIQCMYACTIKKLRKRRWNVKQFNLQNRSELHHQEMRTLHKYRQRQILYSCANLNWVCKIRNIDNLKSQIIVQYKFSTGRVYYDYGLITITKH